MWEEKFHKMEAKYHEYYEKNSIMTKTLKEKETIIITHEGIVKEMEDRILHLQNEVEEWKAKWHHVSKERVEFLESEVKEWEGKYHHQIERSHEWEEKFIKEEKVTWELKEVITFLRKECVRIKEHASFRIRELA